MKRIDLAFTAALVPLDYLAIITAALVAYSVRFASFSQQIRPVTFTLPLDRFVEIIFPLALLFIPLFAASGLYATRPKRLAQEVTQLFVATTAGMGIILLIGFFSRELFDSRFIFLAGWALAVSFLTVTRVSVRLTQRSLRTRGLGVKKTVLIGSGRVAEELATILRAQPFLGFTIAEHFSKHSKVTLKKLRSLADQEHIDALIVADPDITKEALSSLKTFSDNTHITFYYSAQLFPAGAVQPILHTFAEHPIVEIPKTPLDGWGAIYKRIFDIFFSLLFIIITLPIQLIVSAALISERQGAILFHQFRVGQFGEPFKYFKFRSMIKNAHAYRFDETFLDAHGNDRDGSPLFKLKHDPRVTRVGSFIRKFSIDEIPEFYLVLFGRMSLVGPRPHMPEEVNVYAPEQKRVLTIKPGITGMAQVSGRANLSFEDEVRLDMYYIENWSPWLDFIILFKTPFVVLLKRGAY